MRDREEMLEMERVVLIEGLKETQLTSRRFLRNALLYIDASVRLRECGAALSGF